MQAAISCEAMVSQEHDIVMNIINLGALAPLAPGPAATRMQGGSEADIAAVEQYMHCFCPHQGVKAGQRKERAETLETSNNGQVLASHLAIFQLQNDVYSRASYRDSYWLSVKLTERCEFYDCDHRLGVNTLTL